MFADSGGDDEFTLAESDVNAGKWGPPNPRETEKVASMHEMLKADIDKIPDMPYELVSDWKMLRFLRGYGNSRKKACAAYREMLEYYVEADVATIRATMLEASGNDVSKLLWPYYLDEFKPLLDGIWDSVPAAIHHGFDVAGVPVTITILGRYRLPQIIDAGLEELWLQLVRYCDVYFDLLLHEKCVAAGSLVARRDMVDIAGASSSVLTMGALKMLRKMGESSHHYPEAIMRTDAINFGPVGMALWKVTSPFLPKQTRKKFVPHRAPGSLPQLEPEMLPKQFYGCCRCALCKSVLDKVWRDDGVSARGTLTVKIPIAATDVGVPLTWEFVVHGYDVKVGLEFEAAGSAAGTAATLAAQQTWSAEQPTMTGKFTAATPGTLLINLDNKHSYMRSKSVSWRVSFDWDAAAVATAEKAKVAATAKTSTSKIKKTTML